MLVHFFELSGPEAKETLKVFQETLLSCEDVASVSYLQSLDQDNLYLLVVKSQQKLRFSPPQGTRVWHFKIAS